jgi:hypothetical protein
MRCNYLAKPGNRRASSLECLLFTENRTDKMMAGLDGDVAPSPRVEVENNRRVIPPNKIWQKTKFSKAGRPLDCRAF